MRLVTPEQMRTLEELSDANGVGYEELMEQAGKNLFAVIMRQIEQLNRPRILFLCGNGNNGGDCFVAARHLAEQGVAVTVALVSGVPKTILAYSVYKQMGKTVETLSSLKDAFTALKTADIVVDGVYGTGFHGTLRPEIRALFEEAQKRFVIAVDVPSGGDAATGAAADGTMRCRMTVTFGACKFGMVQYPLKGCCGDVLVADIGIDESLFEQIEYPVEVVTETTIADFLPERRPDAHKGQFGKLLCVTGSENMPGAAALSAQAALRCGVGLLRIATAPAAIAAIAARYHEPMFQRLRTDSAGFASFDNYEAILASAKYSSAMLIGCGLGVTEDTKKLVRTLIRTAPCPIILDADGINCVAGSIDILKEAKAGLILTPHAAEMARLLSCSPGEVQENRMYCASKLAKECGVTVVLKGAGTIIATPERAYVNATGNPGMSKGGSGDVLAGMIASFVAQGLTLDHAANFSVYLHGKAGDCAAAKLSEQAMLPSDIIDELPALFLQLERHQNQP